MHATEAPPRDLDPNDALERALAIVPPPRATERIGLAEASGYILASPVIADRDMPACDRSQLDGYALRAADGRAGARLPVVADVPAGGTAPESVPPGACVRIATGAAVPPGLDCVIPHEETDRGDPVTLHEAARPGRAVHPRGADARAGDVIVKAHHVISDIALAAAASAGATHLTVYARPNVTLLTSGDEIRPVETADPRPHEVRNSNGVLVHAMLRRFGARHCAHTHVTDDPAATLKAIRHATTDGTDLLITVGGVSAGERDFFHAAFEKAGVRLAVRGVAMQPGKPIAVGRTDAGMMVVALPGNPLSALVGLSLFGAPIIRKMNGAREPRPRWLPAVLCDDAQTPPRRRAYRPGQWREDGRVSLMRWHGSGNLCSAVAADGIVELPPPGTPAMRGSTVRMLPFGW